MDNRKVVELVEKAKLMDYTDISYAIVESPVGWKSSIVQLRDGLSLFRISLSRIYYIKGILRVDIDPIFLGAPNYNPAKWMCESFSKHLSGVCMLVEKKRGERRKLISGWPTLSWEVYIQYLNGMDELENGKKSRTDSSY